MTERARLLLFLVVTSPAHAQTSVVPQNAPTAFDVASVRPARADELGENLDFDPGKLTGRNVRVRFLIQTALDVQPYQIAGIPKKLDERRFDFNAKMIDPRPDETWFSSSDKNVIQETQGLYRNRLRALLEDRFRLRFHSELRSGKIWALRLLPGIIGRLHPADSTDSYLHMHRIEGGMEIDAKGQTLTSIAKELGYVVDGTVEDLTHRGGTYNLDIKWHSDETAEVDSNLPSLPTALRDAGLILERTRGALPIIVIDNLTEPTAD